MPSDEELRKKAEKHAEEKIGFYIHFTVYIMVNLLLIIIWYTANGPESFPWFIFAMVGWSIGIVVHFVAVFAGGSYKDKLIAKEYDKLKNK